MTRVHRVEKKKDYRMNNLNSIATSVLKNMRFPEASRSIASNAQNGVRVSNAKENFANTATSARGKKRTHGLVFNTNHTNPKGQYKYYYRGQGYARKSANVSNDDTNMNENGRIIYKQNPMTRQTGRIRLARYSNGTRKALFERAVADKNVNEIVRLIDARYVPSRQLATDAIRAMACLKHGLEGVQRILNLRVRFYANEMNDMYAAIVTCSRDRAEALIKAFMKANIVPSSTPPNNRALLYVIDKGLENGLAPKNLKKLVKHALRKDYNQVVTPAAIDRILAAVLGLQAERHPNGRMPRALKEFVVSFGGRRNSLLHYLLTSRPRPARIVRWLVEDAHLRMNMDDVLTALRFRHLQIAIFLASKGQWTNADKTTLATYLQERSNSFSKNARKPRFDRILRDMIGLAPAPRRRNSSFNDPYKPVVDVSSLRNGNIVFYGRQNTYPPKRVHVQRFSEDVMLLNHRDPRLPPNRISSQNNLNVWQHDHGIIRGKTRSGLAQGTYVGKNPLVPPPSNVRNRNNYTYVKANAAARRIQGAYKSYDLKKKERASLDV